MELSKSGNDFFRQTEDTSVNNRPTITQTVRTNLVEGNSLERRSTSAMKLEDIP